MNFLIVIPVLGVLVFVHEFGHYAVAKFFGVRVEVFSLGFGKRLWGFRRGDTDYRISLLPLGGYVKMAGENPMESRTGDPDEFMSHPRWQRFLIAIAGPVMNILLAFVVFTGVFMVRHEYPAYLRRPVDIGSVVPGSAAEKAGIRVGDRIVKFQNLQNPTWDDLLTKIMINPEQPVDIIVRRGNQTMEPMKIVPNVSGPDRMGDAGWGPQNVIGTVERGFPAIQAGIQPGDVIIAANNTPVKDMQALVDLMQQVKDVPMQLTVLRDGQELKVTVKPEFRDSPDSAEKKYRIGIAGYDVEQLPFGKALNRSFEECRKSAGLIFELVGKIIRNKNSLKQMSGPIGIARMSGEALRLGWTTLLGLMALISINLAIFNLFPIPILDGGLMLMLLIEGLMRRDIKQEVKERVYQAAFVFLLLFAAVVIFNDVAKTLPSHRL